MSIYTPRVSIGLPVYNAERYLPEALDSMLAQTFTDLEVIISDNASTDRTEAIARAYAERDERIRYVRNPSNIGARYNFNRVFQLARGEYFKWASHNDVLLPRFVESCVEVLDANPAVVICFTKIVIEDGAGSVTDQPRESMDFCAPTAHERLRQFYASPRVSQTLFGVTRSSVLRRTPLFRDWYGSDRALMQELSLYGCFGVVDEVLFRHRRHGSRSWDVADKVTWFDTGKSGKQVPGYWIHLRSSADMLLAAPLSWPERISCVIEFVRQGRNRWRIWAPILAREATALARQSVSRVQILGNTTLPNRDCPPRVAGRDTMEAGEQRPA